MRLRPQQELLRIWAALSRYSFRDGAFVWGSPAAGNSISDAEQLLCLLYPATTLEHFRLDWLDQPRDDVLESLRLVGDTVTLPVRLVRAQIEYFTRYRDDEATPVFPAGVYADTGRLDLVESYAMGVRISLAALGYARVVRNTGRHAGLREETDRLHELASARLLAAMVGLLRSFVVLRYEPESPHGRDLLRLIGQQGRSDQAVLAEFLTSLQDVRAALSEVVIGSGESVDLFNGPAVPFECGWSWSVVADAPEVHTADSETAQPKGVAAATPELYFTWTVLDAVAELFTQRTRILQLLDDEQQRLTRALQLRWEITLTYWAELATFGDDRWPLERLPWRGAPDGSDYHSLLVTALTATRFGNVLGNTEIRFAHLHRILARLAVRHQIIRPPRADGAIPMVPLSDEPIRLPFTDPDRHGTYRAADFTPILFHAVIGAAHHAENDQVRRSLEDLADLIWEHVVGDRHQNGPVDLDGFGAGTAPNWHNLWWLVAGLTGAVRLVDGDVRRTGNPLGFVHRLLADAETTLEKLATSGRHETVVAQHETIVVRLDRARQLVDDHPARAAAVLYQILATLDELLQADGT